MKEKIGKLLELLNEYEPYIASDGGHRDNLWGYAYQGHSAVFPKELAESYIISARYGFIKWLVENDKIEWEKCGFENEGLSGNWYDKGIAFVSNYDNDTFVVSEFYSPYLQLLMLLSIQDEPINFLISILK